MPARALIFDLDGTLADTLATIGAALNHGLGRLGLPEQAPAAVRRMVGEGVVVLCEKALASLGEPAARGPELLAGVRAFYDEHPLIHARLYEGMRETLDALSSLGARLAVLSNKPHHLTVATVAGLGVAPYFAEILGHREENPRKPDPASALWLASRLGVAPGEVLYVGDTPIDMQTARAAGMRAVAVTWGFRGRDELEPFAPEAFVDAPAQLLELCVD